MKKITILILIVSTIIISITSVTAIAISLNNTIPEEEVEKETLNADNKNLIEQFYNDASISIQDREEMKSLFNMPELFNASNKIDDKDKSLTDNINSYNKIINYLITVIEKNSDESYICLGIDGYTKEDIMLSFASKNGEILELNEDVAAALAEIKVAFSNMGFKLDTIRVKDGYITFDTIDGQYSLVFKLEAIAEKNSLNEKLSKEYIESSQNNWYHQINK